MAEQIKEVETVAEEQVELARQEAHERMLAAEQMFSEAEAMVEEALRRR